MERWLLSFILGAILSLFLPTVPELFLIIIVFITGAITLFANKLRNLSGLLLGAGFIWWCAHHHFDALNINELTPSEVYLKPVSVKGSIISLVNNDDIDKRITLKILSVSGRRLSKPLKVRLTWYKAPIDLSNGDNLDVRVRLKPSQSLANPGSFSYQRWLLSREIIAKGYISNNDNPNPLVQPSPTISQRMLDTLKTLIPDSEVKPLMLALTLGYRQEFTSQHWQVLQNTGTAHLMAISGLHLGIIAALGYWLGRGALMLCPAHWFYRYPLWLLPIVTSCGFAFGYAFISSFSTPTLRALIMVLLFWLLRIVHGRMHLLLWFALGLALVILVRPFALISSSFWLSFLALLSILILIFWGNFKDGKGITQKLWLFIKLQLFLSLFLLPINLLLFGQSSVLPWAANIWILPWFSALLMPMLLLMTLLSLWLPATSAWLADICRWQLEIIWQQLLWLNELEFSLITISSITLMVVLNIAVWVIAQLVRVTPAGKVVLGSLLALNILAGLVVSITNKPATIDVSNLPWSISVLDVGHGLSVVLERGNKALVYDTGASYGKDLSIAQSIIHPYLRRRFVKTPEYLFVSHSDNDHAGGLPYVLEHLKPTWVVANINSDDYRDWQTTAGHLVNPLQSCTSNQTWNWQGLTIKALWPIEPNWQENEDSCVLLVSDAKHQLLLTGDIPASVEKRLLEDISATKIDILIVPHHGSKSSSSAEFIESIQPKHAIFSAAYLNRWNMPSDTVTSRYQKVGAKLYNTADSGMIRLTIGDTGIHAEKYRTDMAPFWFYNQFATLAEDQTSIKPMPKSW
ncbi:DNA internalization-related competence protein ComEC/Rec2 [Thalassotalea sp. PS06]|uniref:DNA internalization-related competence protein ComEC/Rec2 n=1 Tax=Thalassotalea sp. PS06 TaxID=2594005 RepID=UPI00163D4628|nr:DNA internalization-related competence protein ComEC/Rec2 [Thalassotalea sp. PS06]